MAADGGKETQCSCGLNQLGSIMKGFERGGFGEEDEEGTTVPRQDNCGDASSEWLG